MNTLKLTLWVFSFTFLFLNIGCTPTCEQSMPSDKDLDYTNAQNIAMNGNDVTAYFTQGKALQGNPAFQSNQNGIVYHFASEEAKALFEANPTQYLPQYGGFCAVAASYNKVEPVELDLFDVYKGKIYFSRNAKAQKLWNEDKAGTVERATMLWPCLVIDNGRAL